MSRWSIDRGAQMPSEASARLQKMREEVRAEARAGFLGGQLPPWKRVSANKETELRVHEAETHRTPTHEEIKAKLVKAIEARLFWPSGAEEKTTMASKEGQFSGEELRSSADERQRDLGAVLAKAVAESVLPNVASPVEAGVETARELADQPSDPAERIRRAFRRVARQKP